MKPFGAAPPSSPPPSTPPANVHIPPLLQLHVVPEQLQAVPEQGVVTVDEAAPLQPRGTRTAGMTVNRIPPNHADAGRGIWSTSLSIVPWSARC